MNLPNLWLIGGVVSSAHGQQIVAVDRWSPPCAEVCPARDAGEELGKMFRTLHGLQASSAISAHWGLIPTFSQSLFNR